MSLYDEISKLSPPSLGDDFYADGFNDAIDLAAELAKKYDDERKELIDALQLMIKRFEPRQDNLFSQRSACSKASNLLERLNK
jgi:hypothetical protein